MLDKLLLRVGEAAEMLAISRSKAYEMIAAGELPYMKLRGSIRIVQKDLELMIEREKTGLVLTNDPAQHDEEGKWEYTRRRRHLQAL